MTGVHSTGAPAAGGYTLLDHALRTLRFAIPIMLARAGSLILVTVDTVMTGRAGAEELAHYGLSLAPFVFLMVLGIGLLIGVVILTAQRDGAGRPESCGAVWRNGMALAGGLGLLGGLLLLAGEPVFLLLGQSPTMAAGAAEALAMSAVGLPAILLYIATVFFLEGIGRPAPGMVVALSANLVNAGLNWLLIEGQWGLPAMGASGAALATSLTRWLMFAVLAVYVLKMAGNRRYGVRGGLKDTEETARKLFRLGAPLAITTALEVGAFSMVATFAGRMGETNMAGYQVAMNVVTLVFMLSLGFAGATSVRVANAVGRGDSSGIRLAGWMGSGLDLTLMVLLALAIWAAPGPLAAFYTDDPAVQAVAIAGLAVITVMILVDGTQVVLLSATRAMGDVLVPMGIYAVTLWIIGVPLAFVLGVQAGFGVVALFGSMTLALALTSVSLALRFHVIARRGVRPI
jgi:MATE family multidrug resistance protein